MPKVSVLMAVYNAAPYLHESLDSLLAQTLADFEVICIDDCSTDDSLAILNDYARRDSRVVVVRQERNQGQAHARNAGLKVAKGELIAFLDSDDSMSPDCLEQAVAVFDRHPQADCVLLHVTIVEQGTGKTSDYPMEPFTVMSGYEAFERCIDWSIHGWYVARRELYDRFPYDATCKSYSDDNTTRLHYFHSREVRYCQGTYYYRNYPYSVTRKVSVRRFDYLKANESMKRQLQELGVERRIMEQYEAIRVLVLVDSYMVYHCHGKELPVDDRRFALGEMRRVWGNIDRSLLKSDKVHKFGYRLLPRWWMFRLQEWLYFTLRGALGKNK